jgi:hypothetical protein
MSWLAPPGHPARRLCSEHKHLVESWMRNSLAEEGYDEPAELARQITILGEGCMTEGYIHNDPSYVRSCIRAMRTLLARPTMGSDAAVTAKR